MKRWIAALLIVVATAVLMAVEIRVEQKRKAEAAEAALLAEQERLAQEMREKSAREVRIFFDRIIREAENKAAELIEARKPNPPIGIDLAYWQSQNSNIRGYLYSPGTPISYPIIQGSNNEYYLDHDIYGNPSVNGCIMLEHLNASDFSDNNSIIYGHHMKNGSMLASIDRYKNASFYPDHAYMYLYTPEQTYRLDLIAGYSCPADDEVFCTGLTSSQIARFKAKSTFTTNLTDTSGPYVTLCTCSYEHDNWRYVVVCKKVAI